MPTTIKLKNSVTAAGAPTALAQGEVGINVTDKKVWVGNAATTPVQLLGAGATASFTSITTSSDSTISGLTVGKGLAAVATNTAIGASALSSNTTGDGITAIGSGTLALNTTGNGNIAVGGSTPAVTGAAMASNTTGYWNTAVGSGSLRLNTTGAQNVALGFQALTANTTASNNTAIGYQALDANTTGTLNTAIGVNALGSNTTANRNNAFGGQALAANTTGFYNAAFGDRALQSNTTASYNIAVGYSLASNTTGASNTGVGHNTLEVNTTGSNNTAVGEGSLASNTTASSNTAVGYQAGSNCTTNGANTLIGASCGTTLTSGTNNTYLGGGATASGVTVAQEIIICAGNGATGKGANTGFISPNGGAVYQGNNSSTWSTTSDRRLKKNIVDNNTGLDLISQIQVRNFEYRLPEEVDAELTPQDAVDVSGLQLGVIAQELAQVLPDCVKQESTGVFRVDTDNLTWYLINAVKELKAEIDQLKGN
jgi:hypothetical protein